MQKKEENLLIKLSRSHETLDQQLVSPIADNRKCMSHCRENLGVVFGNEKANSCKYYYIYIVQK